MIRRFRILPAICLLGLLGGCAGKYHPPDIDTGWITTLAVVVGQDAGQPVSLTLVESEVSRHLYEQFRLVTPGQLAAALGEDRLRPRRLGEPGVAAEIGRRTQVDAVLEVTVTGHDIGWTSSARHRAMVAIAMQLVEVPSGTVRWIRSAQSSDTAETISEAVHEAVSDAVWDCLKHLLGYESLVRGPSGGRISGGGVTVTSAPSSEGGQVIVMDVASGSTWERAGLRAGDIVLRANGRRPDGARLEWPSQRRDVSLTIRREGKLIELTVPVCR